MFLLLSFNICVSAQREGAVKGLVTDSTSGEVLAYCNVYIPELNVGATTNDRGYFYIPSIPANRRYHLIVSYVGYSTKKLIIEVYQEKITEINIKLSPTVIEISGVKKLGEKYPSPNTTDISLQKIFHRDLEILPKNVESDLFRSLQTLPGVSSTGDVSAVYFVRGGSSDQNLVLLNDVPVYSPFHALGMFSVIDPDMINFVEFYKGGFPLEYNGGLSSLLRIITKDGNKNKFSGILSGSLLSGKAQVGGPFPGGSFLITGRKSYSTAILKKFINNNDIPIDFYDYSFKVNFSDEKFMQDAKFTIHGFFSGDNLTNSSPLKEDFSWTNKILGFKYFQWVTDSPIFYEFSVSESSFESKVIPKFTDSRPRNNRLKDFTAKGDLTYIFDSKDELGVGIKFLNITSELFLENVRGIPVEIRGTGTNVSMHVKYKMLRFEKFLTDFGSRINFTRLATGTAGQMSFEPRLNLSYRVIPEVTLKASWGNFIQELKTLTDEDEIVSIFQPWIITPKYIPPEKAIHYVLGLETNFADNLVLDIEGYYKLLKNLSSVNKEKYFPEDPDLIAGEGESYGLEIGSKYNFNNFTINTSYTLSWAFKELNGVKYSPKYDSRHLVDLVINYSIGSGWSASVAFSYSTGLPFTQIAGYYQKLFFDDIGSRSYSFLPFTILASRNLGRLPDYHRLDLSLSKKIKIFSGDLLGSLSIVNVYDRKNLFYFDLTTGNRINMLPFLITGTLKIKI